MKDKGGMMDNRMVKDNHQQGIERVKQRKGESGTCKGHHGKMGMGKKASWSRTGDAMSPKKA